MASRSNHGSGDPSINEETLLLANARTISVPTPLPWTQLSIMLLAQLCEPMTSRSVYPYINQLISELEITGGDERKVGYYAGLIESLFFSAQAIGLLQWSRISDYVGRKPVLLTGLMGLCISILCFGISRTFWGLAVSYGVCGMLNGNTGVMRGIMSELTDSTNRAQGYSLILVASGSGSALGSLMGGTLSRPHDRFPNVFGAFWDKYPYLLPCIAVASFASVSSIIIFLFFKETMQRRETPPKPIFGTEIPAHSRGEVLAPSPRPSRDDPVPLKELLVFRVVISIANYAVLGFLDAGLTSLQPLFFAMPLEIGGLGLSPPTIGYILGAYHMITGVFQVCFFAGIVRRLGPKQVVFTGISVLIPLFSLFPIMNIVARGLGMSPLVWVLVAIQVALMILMDLAYGGIFIYITSAAPNKRSFGSTHGLAQTTIAVAKALGAVISTYLFSFSVEHNIIGGYGVFPFLTFLSTLALLLVAPLPQGEWNGDIEYMAARTDGR